ncbi:MAG TPA: DUF3999 family protein [Pyrinomonadaceae bacterium]|jgi:hypothetical protein|nr:DUF3999 family protein [Pyrinomonadaceae bacterium]
MKRFGLLLFLIIAATVLVVSVSAQTSLSQWPYYIEVTPEKNEAGLHDAIVPLWVMDKSRPDLADLRLFDSANREIPYAIRIRRDVDERRDIPVRLFNSGTAGPATSEVSVDLGENPGEHNEIEIETRGTNFRRQVAIEGSDSGKEWRTLNNDGVLFSFRSQNTVAESQRVTYPASRYRYLRVKVSRDQLTDNETPQVTNVKVSMAVREKGWLSSWSVPVPSYQLLRNQGAHASAWIIDLGARTPCEWLTLQINDESFSRPFQVESIEDDQNVRLLATGDLTRHAGDEPKPLVIVFNEEANVRKLRLQITDYSNPTLDIIGISASAPARELVFELKEPSSQPLRLFFGNANVTAPHYDFEKELPARLSKAPLSSTVTAVLANREYIPEPLPLTERAPWLIYLVLATASAALGYVLYSLARTATRLKPQTD